MALQNVLVIDDSDAILAFMRAVLSATYTVSTASNGREGLELCNRLRPDVVLLDLSMPEMDGEQVLARLQSDPQLAAIPVLIVSSEQARAEACVRRGAAACLVKPVRAQDVLALVARALEDAKTLAQRRGLAVLPMRIGSFDLAVPLADVTHVLLQTSTTPLPGAPAYLSSFFELYGESVCVLDLAFRFGVEHARPIVDRMLVVVAYEGVKLALCTDHVYDPEAVTEDNVQQVVPTSVSADLTGAVRAVVRTSHGAMPLVHPPGLLSRGLVASLDDLLRAAVPT